MNFEWLLSQALSYLSSFHKAVAQPSILLLENDGQVDPNKSISAAMIFLGLSVGISSIGFDYIFGNEVDFTKVLMTFGLLEILISVVVTIGVFTSWQLAESNLGFNVFLRGTAYFIGVTAILNMIEAFAFLGIIAAFHPGSLQEAKLAIWSVAMNPHEILSDSYPENIWDWAFLLIVSFGNGAYLIIVWWRTYCSLSRLRWAHAAWAFVNYFCFSSLVFGIVRSFTIRRG